jgi:hypothetical protein
VGGVLLVEVEKEMVMLTDEQMKAVLPDHTRETGEGAAWLAEDPESSRDVRWCAQEIVGLTEQLATALIERNAARAVLRPLEWSEEEIVRGKRRLACPCCHMFKARGHAERCKLAANLAEEAGE